MNEEILGLLGVSPEQMQQYQQRQSLAGLQALGTALMQAGAPRQGGRVSTLVGLGQAAPAFAQGRAQEMDNILKSLLQRRQIEQTTAAAKKPSFMTIKTEGGGERLLQISPTSVVSPVSIPGLTSGASPKFDPTTSAFMQLKYPGKSFGDLTPDQQQFVIEFALAPDQTKEADLKRESERAFFETGVRVPVPRGRGSFFQGQPPATTQPVAPTSAVTPTVAPVAQAPSMEPLSAVPVSKDMTPQTAEVSAIRIPTEIATKPLGENEKPLVQSSAITPKAKQELLLVQPKQTQAVEYVLETNAQMQSVINEILANPGFNDAFGFGGTLISQLPGTDAARVRALLERLGGNLFIEAITAMRAASATGAAVGNATEKEGDKLQSSRAALLQAQKAEDVRKELENLRDTLNFQANIVTNSYDRTYGKGSFTRRSPSKPAEQRKPLSDIFKGQ